jgi:hypothetical protein
MLHHQEHQDDQPQFAAEVRVSAQELAEAVEAVEARRSAAEQTPLDTIALGDAVQHLSLDMTPEELLTELQARRVKQAYHTARVQNRARQRARAQAWKYTLGGIGIGAALSAILFLSVTAINLKHTLDASNSAPRTAPSVPPPPGGPAPAASGPIAVGVPGGIYTEDGVRIIGPGGLHYYYILPPR